MFDASNPIAEIKKNFPGIKIKKYYFIETGWMNQIIVVNDGIVFRFPRTAGGIKRLSGELKLLPLLKNSPFMIPEYKFIHIEDQFFAGYQMIAGDTMVNAKSLGNGVLNDSILLLNYLQKFDRDSFKKTYLQIYNSNAWIRHEKYLVDSFRGELEAYTGNEYFDEVFDLMDIAMSDLDDGDISLIHGDLSGENIILNRRHSRINGIIDWSDASYGDRALDIAAIIDGFSLKYLTYILKHFNTDFSSRAVKRILLYRLVSPFYRAYFLEKTGKHTESEELCVNIINNRELSKLKTIIKDRNGYSKFITQ